MNFRDLFFGQGYVVAQDRLWQLEFSRLVSQGALSTILGMATSQFDIFLRTLGFHRLAKADEQILKVKTIQQKTFSKLMKNRKNNLNTIKYC